MTKTFSSLLILAVFSVGLPIMAVAGGGHDHGHGHGHDNHADEPAKGPHGGRLLSKDDFAVEITIFEKGVPPQFRVFAYQDEHLIKPDQITATIKLNRFGGDEEEFILEPAGEYMTSHRTVEEPHSFDVNVSVAYKNQQFRWSYQSHEGRTELSEEGLRVAALSIEKAGPQEIANVANVYGRLLPNQDRVSHIKPRFAGVVREIRKELGDRVERGELLAVIESNQSLQSYEIRSHIAGEVIKRHATVGEFIPDGEEIFVVADLSEIVADFQVYRDDFGQIEKGQLIKIDLGGPQELEARVSYVSPITDEATQSKLVRAVIPNPQGLLRPGLFVSGTLANAYANVPVAVRREAIQTFRDWNVVYLTDGHVFQAMPVELGRSDTTYVEVTAGISAGAQYVAKNSFIIKADIEKSGASHDH